ncbi:hypothetical protein F5Y17DRAFT_417227 [Xylariaceae sp. FL0594]|nr:hypothetical protein F5Y17DRAFT_417227 [Xylariaceae sp. FL0594]
MWTSPSHLPLLFPSPHFRLGLMSLLSLFIGAPVSVGLYFARCCSHGVWVTRLPLLDLAALLASFPLKAVFCLWLIREVILLST